MICHSPKNSSTLMQIFLHLFVGIFSFLVLIRPVQAQISRCEDLLLQTELSTDSSQARFQQALLVAATLGATFYPYLAMAGGFSGVGGGEGLLLFPNKEDARLAKTYIQSHRPIPDDLLSKAQIKTLDRWEMEKAEVTLMPHTQRDTAQTLLERAQSNLRLISPLLANRLHRLSPQIGVSQWTPLQFLPRIGDANPTEAVPDTAVRVQLAARFSQGDNPLGLGPVQSELRLQVVYDARLFQLLSPIDQAMLIFHEHLYALGRSVGHPNSNNMRQHVRAYFAENFTEWRARSQGHLIFPGVFWILQQELVRSFGDYILFFAQTAPERNHPRFSPQRHFDVFRSLVREMRPPLSECRQQGGSPLDCWHRVVDQFGASSQLDDEQSFIYMLYYHYFILHKALHAEAIMDPQNTATEQLNLINHFCRILRQNIQHDNVGSTVKQNALNYCQSALSR